MTNKIQIPKCPNPQSSEQSLPRSDLSQANNKRITRDQQPEMSQADTRVGVLCFDIHLAFELCHLKFNLFKEAIFR